MTEKHHDCNDGTLINFDNVISINLIFGQSLSLFLFDVTNA